MTCEAYAKRYNKMHPRLTEFLQPYFKIELQRVRILVTPIQTSALDTSMWVLGNTVMMLRGKFNYEFKQWRVDKGDGKNYYDSNRAVDLSTSHGMLNMMHECYHVQQWLTRPWWMSLWTWVTDMFRSYENEKRVWAHKYSKWEQEAIEFVGRHANDVGGRETERAAFALFRSVED